LQSSNALSREVFPLKSLSLKNMSSATKQATLNLLSVSSAFGINSSPSFLFLLMLLELLSSLFIASLALVREALSLNGDLKSRALVGCSVTLEGGGGVNNVSVRVVSQAVLEGNCPVAFLVAGQMRYNAFAGRW
jgi:hypothetical protein